MEGVCLSEAVGRSTVGYECVPIQRRGPSFRPEAYGRVSEFRRVWPGFCSRQTGFKRLVE